MCRRETTSPLLPYTTLFRSACRMIESGMAGSILERITLIPARMARSSSATGATLPTPPAALRSEEHTSELQSRLHLVCRLLLEKKKRDRCNDHIDRLRHVAA